MKHISGNLSVSDVLATPLALQDEAQGYSQQQKLLTMVGVLLVMLLASLDQTVVSTAMPRIVAELQGFDRYTWVSTAYLLSSTVTVPIYGELSDLFGRKPIFLVGIVIFLTGSALSGASQSMDQLIIFRAFQGLGAGALLPIAMTVVGDLFAPRERGRWQGILGAVFGLSSVIGPTAGGWITQNFSWHWVFYINLPVGIIALLALIFLMPSLKRKKQHISIDYIGAALLVLGSVPLLLGFTWAGSHYPWLSPQIIGLLVGSGIVLTLFVLYEAHVAQQGGDPILEPSLFKNSTFTISILVTFAFGMSLFGSIFFIPLFAQGVTGTSATNSGLVLTPLMLTAVVGSIGVGQLVSRFGRYKLLAIIGMVISLLGTLLLVRLDIHSTNNDVLIAMIVLGIGMGFAMALYTIIVQNALPDKLGQATSGLSFFRQIGGTIGLAVMGSFLSSAYLPAFTSALPAQARQIFPPTFFAFFNNPQVLLSPDTQAKLHATVAQYGPQGTALLDSVLNAAKIGLVQGIHLIFIFSVAALSIGLVLLFFLKEIPLKSGSDT